MTRFKVNDIAFLNGELVLLHTRSSYPSRNPGWGVANFVDHLYGQTALFGVKETRLHPVIWTFTGFVRAPHGKG